MLLKSLTLHNIRSYTDMHIDFPLGSVLLSGDIGAGKSTLLISIEFALFGILRGDISGDSLLRTGSQNGFIELLFAVEDKEVLIHRTLKSQKETVKQDAGFMVINGKKNDFTAVEMRSHILELLGYPTELITRSPALMYRYTVYTPQDLMKHILFDDSSARLDTVRRVFGVDKYKRVIENADIILRMIREKRKEILLQISDLDTLHVQKDQLEKTVESLTISLVQKEEFSLLCQKKTIDAKSAFISAQNNFAALQNIQKESVFLRDQKMQKERDFSSSFTELSSLINGKQELEKKIESLPLVTLSEYDFRLEEDVKKDEEEYAIIAKSSIVAEQSLIFLDKKRNEILFSIEEKKKILEKNILQKEIAKKIQEELQEKSAAEEKKIFAEKEFQKVEKAIQQYEILLQTAKELKEKIETLSHCPTCLQPVYEDHKHAVISEQLTSMELYQEHMNEVRLRKEEIEKNLNLAKQECNTFLEKEYVLAQLKGQLSSLDTLQKEIDLLLMQNETVMTQKQAFLAKVEQIGSLSFHKEKILEKKKILQNFEQKKQILKDREFAVKVLEEKQRQVFFLEKNVSLLREDIEKITQNLLEKEKSLANFSEIQFSKEVCEKNLDSCIREERIIEVQKANIAKEKEMQEANLLQISNSISAKQKLQLQIQVLAKKQDWLEKHFQPVVQVIEKHVLARVHQECNSLFQQWAQMLLDDESLQFRLAEDFSPVAIQNGHDVDVSYLSGGEKTSCALAYRLALHKIINNFVTSIRTRDILILDEPTDGFSSEQLDKVRDVLDQLQVKQTIIVSHEPKLESFVDHVIRIAKTNHESRILG